VEGTKWAKYNDKSPSQRGFAAARYLVGEIDAEKAGPARKWRPFSG
jgi:hypothetical protein